MLIDFTVENFRSIKEPQTLSLLATKAKEHFGNTFTTSPEKNLNLLRSCLIYGANASGKSNIVKAINEFKMIILHSTDLKFGQEIPSYEPFKLDLSCNEAPTKFEMEFIPREDGIRYRYLIEITKFHVEREELFFYPKSQPALLFSRNKGEAIRYGGYLQGKKKNIESELLENNLFLSKAANSNNKQLQEIYLYFLSTLSVMVKGTVDELISKNRTSRAMLSEENKALRKKVETLLISVDTGISALNVSRREMDDEIEDLLASDMPKVLKDAMTDNFVYRTRTIHKLYEDGRETGTVTFDLSEESEGTIKLYGISATIIETLLEGSILVIDEIDNSLHPHITALILKLFNDPKTNRNNAQLIAITHDASLLDPKFVRRDQVWFTKKVQNSTELYSLVEFDKNEVRAKTQFGEWYLDGRFNAVPVINKSIYEIFSEIE